ncbi:MAG TPA: D-sedoheptulose 7-phosphate isomerase [Patescibacteria group bacterium]|nr:D-sedoheptulose 7-phosphate isomerase [Patescibacteria group bacterium]
MPLKLKQFWQSEFDEHLAVTAATQDQLAPAFEKLLDTATRAIEGGNKIFFFGNGGSASDAQHLATELSARYKKDRKAIAAVSLATDTSALTAIGNDYGFDYVFARQLEALGKKGDVAIGITTSGNSANVIRAFEECRKQGITTVGFTGATGGKIKPLCDILINVPSTTTARIQEMHITLGQMFCGGLEINLGYIEQEEAPAGLARAV